MFFLLMLLILAACGFATTPTNQPSVPVTLRIAVLPILDTLPMYVAQEENLFDKYNVKVEFIPVASAAERDQLIAAGQADGMVNETISTILYNKEQVQVQTVRFARVATSTAPLFHILASAQSGITDSSGLKGVEIGISQGTVIEYLTDRLLQAEGFSSAEIKTIAVPRIPDRLSLLSSGELDAAMLPDPSSFLGAQQGAVFVLDDSEHPEYSYSVITFRKAVTDQSPDAIRSFLAAIEEATRNINQNPAQYQNLLTEKQLVPAPLIGTYQVNPFPTAGVPDRAQWEDALAWMREKGLINVDVSYESSVTDAFLPNP
jgi:NitT/TauT family transport system substrate-binding protein